MKSEYYRGKLASKRRYFYGFRVQVVTTAAGQAVQFFILPGSLVDVRALPMLHLRLPSGSELFGDAGYTDYEQESPYADCEGITLQIQRRCNSRQPDEPWQAAYKKQMRQRIEQVFSQITLRFPKTIHAVTENGFLLKIVLFLLAYTFETNLHHTT